MLLERLFENLALSVQPFATCVVSSGWRLRMARLDWVTLHFVLRGTGRLRVGKTPPQPLGPYSLAIVPRRRVHALEGGERASSEASADGGAPGDGPLQLVAGPEGDREMLVACGGLQARYAGGLGLFDLLVEPIVLDFSDSEEMRAVFARLLEESGSPSVGREAMLNALMNECLVLVFRRLCDSPDCHLPWLRALEDPRMAGVLGTVLERPERPYSLELLASMAAMSRSAFAREFAACFGRTPMAFVRDVRLRHAARLLRGTDLAVDAVARRVGFSSRSHFTHAFRDYFGRTPRSFRAEAS